MHLRARIIGWFRKQPAPPPAPSPFQTRAASADEVLSRLADVDYELYGRDAEPKPDDQS